jgi:PIN like domain
MKKEKKQQQHEHPSISETQQVIFFIDRCLGRGIVPRALRAAGATVEIHDEHFPPDTRDEDWLVEVGNRHWVVLTQDKNIRYHDSEILSIAQANVRVFVLASTHLSGDANALTFVNTLPIMTKFALNNQPPFIVNIYHPGQVITFMNNTQMLRKIKRDTR